MLDAATPATPTPAPTRPDPSAAVFAADNQRVGAMVNGDLTALALLLSEDLSYIHSSGAIDGKASYIASLRDGALAYGEVDPLERRATPLAADVVLLEGRMALTLRQGEAEKALDILFTALWLREGPAWRLRSWQSTNAPAAE